MIKLNNNMSVLRAMLNFVSRTHSTPAELYKLQKQKHLDMHNRVSTKQLIKGAERQWARLNDTNFQTEEMIRTLDQLIPNKNK